MNWNNVFEIIVAVITSVGGISGIIVAAIKLSAGIISDRLAKKFEANLSKELELFKAQLGKREYVSRTRFDTEFCIYRELSRVFFDYVKAVCVMIPPGYSEQPADEEQRKKLEAEHFSIAQSALVAAQDVLHQNAPFIQKDFFLKYDKLLQDGHMQMGAYTKRYDKHYYAPQSEKERFTFDDYKRSGAMLKLLQELSDDIRQYLSKLDVAE